MTPASEPVDPMVPRLIGLSLTEARAQLKQYLARRSPRRWSLAPLPASVWQGHKVIGLFGPKLGWDEPSGWPSLPPDVRTAYASTIGQDLVFRECAAADLISNPMLGVLQAPDYCPLVSPTMILVPALLADRSGCRIGRGGGFYDRYLERHPHVRSIAVLHSDYVYERLPSEWLHAKDARVTGLLTEIAYQEMKQC